MTESVDQWRPPGARNFFRVGGHVAVRQPAKRVWVGKVTKIEPQDDGTAVFHLTVAGKLNGEQHSRQGAARTISTTQAEISRCRPKVRT